MFSCSQTSDHIWGLLYCVTNRSHILDCHQRRTASELSLMIGITDRHQLIDCWIQLQGHICYCRHLSNYSYRWVLLSRAASEKPLLRNQTLSVYWLGHCGDVHLLCRRLRHADRGCDGRDRDVHQVRQFSRVVDAAESGHRCRTRSYHGYFGLNLWYDVYFWPKKLTIRIDDGPWWLSACSPSKPTIRVRMFLVINSRCQRGS